MHRNRLVDKKTLSLILCLNCYFVISIPYEIQLPFFIEGKLMFEEIANYAPSKTYETLSLIFYGLCKTKISSNVFCLALQ